MSGNDDIAGLIGPVTVNVPVGLASDDQATVVDWTWAHGIDPYEVPLPAKIVFQDGQVTFEPAGTRQRRSSGNPRRRR